MQIVNFQCKLRTQDIFIKNLLSAILSLIKQLKFIQMFWLYKIWQTKSMQKILVIRKVSSIEAEVWGRWNKIYWINFIYETIFKILFLQKYNSLPVLQYGCWTKSNKMIKILQVMEIWCLEEWREYIGRENKCWGSETCRRYKVIHQREEWNCWDISTERMK